MPAEKSATWTALLLGDVVGAPGRKAVSQYLPLLKAKYEPLLVVVNGENAEDSGAGLTPENVLELWQAGADVITTGNHVWEQESLSELLASEPRLLRPANYPQGLPGHGLALISPPELLHPIAVLNLQGRYRLAPIDDPFQVANTYLESLKGQTPFILVDFHAEDTSEKEAMGWALDGRVTAVVGSHTHVATRDERILPQGTAFQTDLGMCGPRESIIGNNRALSLRRALTQLPLKGEVADGPSEVRGLRVEVSVESGKALAVERLCWPVSGSEVTF